MADIVKEIKDNEKKINIIINEKARQDGQKEQLMKQLKQDFNIESLDIAVTELEKLDNEVKENEKALEKINTELVEIINNSGSNNK